MSTLVSPQVATTAQDDTSRTILRWLPLAGAVYAVLQIAGNLVIDAFPDENTPLGKLTSYYAGHHSQIARGGHLLEISAVFIALFGVALAVRVGRSNLVAAVTIVVAAATACLADAYEGATFQFLGEHGNSSSLSPQALQAWHVSAASFGTIVPTLLLVIGLVLGGRTLPAWLVWSAVVLVVAQFTPVGFLASLVMLLWFLVAGIALAVKPAR